MSAARGEIIPPFTNTVRPAEPGAACSCWTRICTRLMSDVMFDPPVLSSTVIHVVKVIFEPIPKDNVQETRLNTITTQ